MIVQTTPASTVVLVLMALNRSHALAQKDILTKIVLKVSYILIKTIKLINYLIP